MALPYSGVALERCHEAGQVGEAGHAGSSVMRAGAVAISSGLQQKRGAGGAPEPHSPLPALFSFTETDSTQPLLLEGGVGVVAGTWSWWL